MQGLAGADPLINAIESRGAALVVTSKNRVWDHDHNDAWGDEIIFRGAALIAKHLKSTICRQNRGVPLVPNRLWIDSPEH